MVCRPIMTSASLHMMDYSQRGCIHGGVTPLNFHKYVTMVEDSDNRRLIVNHMICGLSNGINDHE